MITGLNVNDFLRLNKLKKKLNGNDREDTKPDTAQKTITFEKMYKDGVCKVKDRLYTKMVEFYDLNYELLDMDERKDLLGLYSRFINYFDPEIKMQLFLFNRKVNEKVLNDQFDIKPRGDMDDCIRKEYLNILKEQNKKGTNGIIKSKYLIFGIEADSVNDARVRLNNIEADIIKNLMNLGTEAHSLNGKERLEILHDYLNQYTMEPFFFSFEEMAKSGKNVKDYIAPPGFDFRFPSRFKTGRMYGSVAYIDVPGPKMDDEVLQKILDLDSNLTVSIHIQTIDSVKAMKMIKNALTNIQKAKIEEQKKAVRSGYDMDILPTDIMTDEKNILELLNDMNTSNQKVTRLSFLVSCFGRTKRELETLQQRIAGILQPTNCVLRVMQYMQEQGMNACAPIGINETEIERILTTRSTAILVPFNTQELFMHGQALYYGLNALSNNMIMADRKKLRTPNGLILGTPGAGKSFAAKREILAAYLVTSDDILICDPEGEYYPLVEKLGGQVVKLASNSKDYLNPMDINISDMGDREALKIKSDFLITLCDAIAGDKVALANDEKGIVDRCINAVYTEYFKNPVPENMPILEDLYNALLHYIPDDVESELARDAREKAVRIANSLVLYVHGSQNYFNHRTNVDSQNRIVCFDIRDLGNQLKELGMLIVQDAVWNRVSVNRERKNSTRYYCDEYHLLLRDKQTAKYMVEIWKRFRKWGGIPTGITQNVVDFLQSEEIEGILGNSDFIYLLNQNSKDKEIVVNKFGLTKEQLKYVTNSEKGCGLMFFDRYVIPFVDRYPEDTETFRIMDTRPKS